MPKKSRRLEEFKHYYFRILNKDFRGKTGFNISKWLDENAGPLNWAPDTKTDTYFTVDMTDEGLAKTIGAKLQIFGLLYPYRELNGSFLREGTRYRPLEPRRSVAKPKPKRTKGAPLNRVYYSATGFHGSDYGSYRYLADHREQFYQGYLYGLGDEFKDTHFYRVTKHDNGGYWLESEAPVDVIAKALFQSNAVNICPEDLLPKDFRMSHHAIYWARTNPADKKSKLQPWIDENGPNSKLEKERPNPWAEQIASGLYIKGAVAWKDAGPLVRLNKADVIRYEWSDPHYWEWIGRQQPDIPVAEVKEVHIAQFDWWRLTEETREQFYDPDHPEDERAITDNLEEIAGAFFCYYDSDDRGGKERLIHTLYFHERASAESFKRRLPT